LVNMTTINHPSRHSMRFEFIYCVLCIQHQCSLHHNDYLLLPQVQQVSSSISKGII